MTPIRALQLQANIVQRERRKGNIEGDPTRYLTLYPREGLEPDEARDRRNAMDYLVRRGLWPPRPGDTREDRVAYEYLIVVAWHGIGISASDVSSLVACWSPMERELVETALAGRLLSLQLKDCHEQPL